MLKTPTTTAALGALCVTFGPLFVLGDAQLSVQLRPTANWPQRCKQSPGSLTQSLQSLTDCFLSFSAPCVPADPLPEFTQGRFSRPVSAGHLCMGQEFVKPGNAPPWLGELVFTAAAKVFSSSTQVTTQHNTHTCLYACMRAGQSGIVS